MFVPWCSVESPFSLTGGGYDYYDGEALMHQSHDHWVA